MPRISDGKKIEHFSGKDIKNIVSCLMWCTIQEVIKKKFEIGGGYQRQKEEWKANKIK